jgi:hypothetical protein
VKRDYPRCVVKSVPKADAARPGADERPQHATVRDTPSAKGSGVVPSRRGVDAKAREAEELKKKRRKNAVVEVMLADLSNDRRREDD